MNREDIQLLYEYNRWANARVLHAAAPLTGEQFTRDLASSYRSVRDTLTHILSAEWIWLQRWKGALPQALHDPKDFESLDALKAWWAGVEGEQAEFVQAVSDAALGNVVSYVNTRGETWRYPLGQMMQHVVNHSSYHRGQVATLLRQLGGEPAPTDFLLFFDEKGKEPGSENAKSRSPGGNR